MTIQRKRRKKQYDTRGEHKGIVGLVARQTGFARGFVSRVLNGREPDTAGARKVFEVAAVERRIIEETKKRMVLVGERCRREIEAQQHDA